MNPANKQASPVALVTAGARRVGAAIVGTLHQAGYQVVIHCHNSLAQAHELAAQLNRDRSDSALVLSSDLTQEPSAAVLIQEVVDWKGRLDVLVNNASAFFQTDVATLNNHDWQLLFNLNVRAPFLLSCAARPWLKKQQGVIVNITDIHAEKPLKGYAVYSQTKAALNLQTQALALEFAPEIRVNAVAPGPCEWPEGENSLTLEEQQQVIDKTLLKRFGSKEYVAHAVLALVGNDYITGQVLRVDGGRSVK